MSKPNPVRKVLMILLFIGIGIVILASGIIGFLFYKNSAKREKEIELRKLYEQEEKKRYEEYEKKNAQELMDSLNTN